MTLQHFVEPSHEKIIFRICFKTFWQQNAKNSNLGVGVIKKKLLHLSNFTQKN